MVTIAGWQESCLTVELERTRKLGPLPALNELQVCERKKRKLLTLNQLLLFFLNILIRNTEQVGDLIFPHTGSQHFHKIER